MKWWLIWGGMFLWGCTFSSSHPHGEQLSQSHCSPQEFKSLWSDTPQVLQLAIAGEVSQNFSNSPSLSDSGEICEPHSALVELLIDSEDPLLKPDDAYWDLNQLVNEEPSPQADSFAIALADYLLLNDFECRQPVLAQYFNRRYGILSQDSICREPISFIILDRHDGPKPLFLDPERIRSIHLLFGGQGPSLASSFGHVALRLIVCPGANSTDEECAVNLQDHVVLGYMAHIDEFELNTFKALSGNYKAYLFANPFLDTYQNYAITEFREVYSLPLNLSKEERELFVRELSEIHFRFAGDYTFFTKNCATLLQKTLKELFPGFADQPGLEQTYLRPDRFFAAVGATAIADGEKLDSKEMAENEGFYFSSTRPFYEEALAVVKEAMQAPSFESLDDYLLLTPVTRLQNIMIDADYFSKLGQNRYLLEAQMLLEELAFVRSERRFFAEASRYLQQLEIADSVDEIYTQLNNNDAQLFTDCVWAPIQQLTQPIPRLAEIPEPGTLPTWESTSSQCRQPASRKRLAEIMANIDGADSEQWQRVQSAAYILATSLDNNVFLKEF